MLTIPDAPVVDKDQLIGLCSLLPLRFDAGRLLAELNAIPAEQWGSTGGRVGVHMQAEAIFLRGHAPAEGDLPVQDRPVLEQLPYARELIYSLIPAQPLRCLFARLKPMAVVALHIDRFDYFKKTIRLHFPIITSEHAYMLAGDQYYSMQVGEIWALNNSGMHGVLNENPSESRTHMICDFLPSPALLDLIGKADRNQGHDSAAIQARLTEIQAQPRN
jgi:hypothetical protein